MFEKRHYEAIARVLRENEHRHQIREALIDLFEKDNPRFDEVKFREKSFYAIR